jgi:hypothetical protein
MKSARTFSKSIVLVTLLLLAACGKSGENQQIAPVSPPIFDPNVTCIGGQLCTNSGIVRLANGVHYSGVVTLDSKDSTKQLIKSLASIANGNYHSFCWGCGSADYSHGYLDLRAQAAADGQIYFNVTLSLGTATDPQWGGNSTKTATINVQAPAYAIANGTGSQIQISSASPYANLNYGYNPYSGNLSGHKFSIVSKEAPLDGTAQSIQNVQIILDDQYGANPAFGTVNLTQQNNYQQPYGSNYY